MAIGDNRRAIQIAALDLQKINTAFAQISNWITMLEGRSGNVKLRDSLSIQSEKQTLIDFETVLSGKACIAVYGADNATLAFAKGSRKEDNGEWVATDTVSVIWALDRAGDGTLYVNTNLTIGQAFEPTVSFVLGSGGAVTDHGALTGLSDDDHTQYLNTTRHNAIDAADHGSGAAANARVLTADGSGGASWVASTTGVTDHGALTGLADNDHPQYVLTVEPGTGTLSTALAAASTSTTFRLKAGTYTETTLDVPNALTEFSIIGQGPGVTFISITGTGIGINASDVRRNKVVLRGFTLFATTNAPTWAISIWGRSHNSYVNNMILLKDISIERTSATAYFSSGGVRLENCFEARLENVHVRNKPSDKVGVAFQLESSVVCNLMHCTATEVATAFKTTRAADWTRVENALSGGDAANQYYHGTEGCRFFGCESYICTVGWSLGTRSLDNVFTSGTLAACSDQAIEDNGASILGLEGFNSLTDTWTDGCTVNGSVALYLKMQGWRISNNVFNGNYGNYTYNYGLYSAASSFTLSIISNNIFRGFHAGIVFSGPDKNKIHGNIFQGIITANQSVYFLSGSDNNTVIDNQFTDSPGYTDGGSANIFGLPASTSDHGALTGLSDDDHPQYVLDSGDIVTGTLAVGETAGITRHASLQVVTGGVGGSANVRIANEKIAAIAGTYGFWRTPLTIWNNYGSTAAAGNTGGITGVNTGLRVISGTDNPTAAAGTPGADAIVGNTLFTANGTLTDPKNLWGLNNLVHYYRNPAADPTSGILIYNQENEMIFNIATDCTGDPWKALTAGETRADGVVMIAHTDNPKKATCAFVVDAGGYTVGSGGRAGTNWWKVGLGITRCSETGILFDTRASEVGTPFATAGIYFKTVPNFMKIIRSDNVASDIHLAYAGNSFLRVVNESVNDLFFGLSAGNSGDATIKQTGIILYHAGTRKWTLKKTTTDTFEVYDDNNSRAAISLNGATSALSLFIDGSLKAVTVGASDSGGTGYKVLRVPN